MKAYGMSIKGEDHEENEDAFLVDEKLMLFAVADGVSIPRGGGKAAKLAIKLLREFFAEEQDLEKACLLVNAKICEERIKGLCGFTTLTAVHIANSKANICSVGDSPAFLIRGKSILLLTESDRLIGSSLTQAIGEEFIEVHSSSFECKGGDILLLMTDGVADLLSPEEIFEIATHEKTPKEICENILKACERKRQIYNDDKTIVCVVI